MSLTNAGSSKAARTDGGLGMGEEIADNTITVDTNQLSFLLDQKFETAAKRSENHIDTSIKGLREELENIDSKHDKKHIATNEALAKLESKINNAVESFTTIAAASASSMQASTDAAIFSATTRLRAEPTVDLPVDASFTRAADPARLKLFAMLPTTPALAIKGAYAICDKADIDRSNYTFTPLGNPALSRAFAIDFVGGDAKTNAARARKAKACLRGADGSWLELTVPTPADGDTKAYINFDKNPKTERIEKLSKILFKIAESQNPDKKFFMDRTTGTLKLGWTPIASISAPSASEISLKWNNGGIAKAGIDKNAIKEAFDTATGDSANVEWSS